MENSMTITKTRNESKLILKNMPAAVQAACDKIFVAGADFGGAIIATNEKDRAFRLALLDASNAYGKPENSPYKGFGEFACAVFGFTSAPSVTNAVRVAEMIDVPNIPKLGAWYSTSQLYELRGVAADTLKADVQNGTLHAGMTTQELREYRKAHELDDGKADVVPMFAAHIIPASGAAFAFDGTMDELRDKMRSCIDTDADIEDDRFGTFNPHATELRGKKQVKGKGLFLCFGTQICTAVYYPAERTKASADAATVKAQNATIAELMARIKELEAKQG